MSIKYRVSQRERGSPGTTEQHPFLNVWEMETEMFMRKRSSKKEKLELVVIS